MQVSQREPLTENILSRHGSSGQVHRSLLRKYHRLLYPFCYIPCGTYPVHRLPLGLRSSAFLVDTFRHKKIATQLQVTISESYFIVIE